MDSSGSKDKSNMNNSHVLKTEANALLHRLCIFKILSRYGHAEATGSYLYNMMTWRDIDLCLTVPKLSVKKAFSIGTHLADLPGIATMYFRNELVLKTKGNPQCVFWCLEFVTEKLETWKIDILISTSKVIKEVLRPGQELLSKLTDDNRRTIIELKAILCEDLEYRRSFRSTDIYEAVVNGNVNNIEQWEKWLKGKKPNKTNAADA